MKYVLLIDLRQTPTKFHSKLRCNSKNFDFVCRDFCCWVSSLFGTHSERLAGISEIREHLESWQWRYGKSPKFAISRSFAIPDNLLLGSEAPNELKVTMVVENGMISDVSLYIPPGLFSAGFSGNVNVVTSLKGHKFSEEALTYLEWSVGGLVNDKEKFVTDCVRQVMTSV